jgi:hypothetical protein
MGGPGVEEEGALPAELRRAGDGFQRPLRSRFQPRLTPSVAMTSNVKSREQLFLGLHAVYLAFVHRKSQSQ